MADDKKTQIGPTGPLRQTGSGPVAATAPAYTPPPATDPGAKTSYLPPVADPLIGQTLNGRYYIQKKLGEGGMGAVYLATHNLLEKQVALKVLHAEFSRKADLVERFMQEAKSASRIRHENVIDISDFGTTPEGLVFFAMELLRGHDLHEEIARARLAGQLLPWARSKKMFLQICSALSAAHAQGIIHRDLKPENVYLVEFLGEPDFVKLLDFGIAKMTEVSEGDRKLTRTGMLFGTPEYMSPEQARGDQVDHRVDVYAMGCILFQLVTGKVPFEADNFMGVLSLHLTEPPPIIPVEVFDRIGAPRAIGAIVDRALSKDRAQRWPTIDDLANAIRAACGDPPARTAQQPAVRPASVPAPETTTQARTTPAPVSAQTRQRTAWTGNLQIPTEDEPKPAGRSKLPLIIGAVVVVGAGGAVAAYLATRGGGTPADKPEVASGSAFGGSAGTGSAPIVQATPDAAVVVVPALPEHVHVHLDSTPPAEVKDSVTGKSYGKTPIDRDLLGSRELITFSFHAKGYADLLVDYKPEHDLTYAATLKKGTGTIQAGSGSAVIPHAGSGSAGSATTAITHPDTGSGSAKPPPDSGSGTKVCPEDGSPCLWQKNEIKGFGSGSGSGSGS